MLVRAILFTAINNPVNTHSKNMSLFAMPMLISYNFYFLRGLLNDGFYAESFSRSRWMSSTWGPRRIKQASIFFLPTCIPVVLDKQSTLFSLFYYSSYFL
jgi:hypothetical protein